MSSAPAADETPLMRQYLEVKQQHPDCIVFFRLGDFYEMFFDDAVVAARALDLTLTSRDKNKESPTPMCGVPHHAAQIYVGKLIELGHKVAICEQVEDPKQARGIVRREVVRVITPGVIIDEEQLEAKASNYVVAALPSGARAGVAYVDVSTGEFAATEVAMAELESELGRLAPRELLAPEIETETENETETAFDAAALCRRMRIAFTALPPTALSPAESQRRLKELLGGELDVKENSPLALAAAAAVIAYAKATQPRGTLPIVRLRSYLPSQFLVLDASTRINLELAQRIGVAAIGKKRGTLLSILDGTSTAMGGRLLRRWLAEPLTEVAPIRRRHDAVEWLVEHASIRAALTTELGEVYDIERLAGRARLGAATPRELAFLGRSLTRLQPIAQRLAAARTATDSRLAFPELVDLGTDLGDDMRALIVSTLADDPPAKWQEGGYIRAGHSAAIDELNGLANGGKDRLAEIEIRERERTGISSLKIRYNRVFGYFLEITNTHKHRVPADYVRKQTLANAERYVTAELAEYEAKILGADEKRLRLEVEAFESLRTAVAVAAPRLLALGARVAALDVLCALADLAHRSGYCRPEVDDSHAIELYGSRHPVVEALVAAGKFVPNDVALDAEDDQLLLITGPNMAGKSTVMRQVALCVIMAQMGSFVPAKSARIGICDRLFTRVGASDNLAEGDSTFMVEMKETATILAHATRRSLVILDEIGRGTSTYDGLSIAWAVAEFLHDRIGARTMFATHYHEMTALSELRPRIRNLSTSVREWQGEIVFLHQLVAGGASRSYGIHVARLAGIAPTVIARAQAILEQLERGEGPSATTVSVSAQLPLLAPSPTPRVATLASLPTSIRSSVEQALHDADIDGMTPRAALAFLAELQARLHKS